MPSIEYWNHLGNESLQSKKKKKTQKALDESCEKFSFLLEKY